jgi:hypothetical protein
MMPEHIEISRRSLVRALLLASGAAAPLLKIVNSAQAFSRAPIVPGVQEFTGDLRLNGRPARRGDLVSPGDTATTGPNSSAVIIIGQHAFMLRANSTVEFYPVYFEKDGVVSGAIKVATGAMLAVFGQNKETTIATPIATIGIRGTGCYVETDSKRSYVCLCYGRADLGSAPTGRLLETVETTSHDKPRYIYPPGAPSLISSAPVIDHSDDELRLLEALVHRVPPFDDNDSLQEDRY